MMFARVPILVDQPRAGAAVAQLLDAPMHQGLGASVEQAMRSLKRRLTREIKKHKVSHLHTWKSGTLRRKSFSIQPAVFHNQRRYPAGPRVNLPVRYVELVDRRDELFVLLPDFEDMLYIPERKLLRTMLSESVRSQTAALKPQQVQQLWPSDSSELRWMRLKLTPPRRFAAQQRYRTLTSVAEPMTNQRNLTIAGSSRDTELRQMRMLISKGSCLVVGESGVGKSTLVSVTAREFEVQRRKQAKEQRSSNPGMSDMVKLAPGFWLTSGSRLIAGMRYLGQWQQRLEELVAELADIEGVLVVENLLNLVSVGGSEPRDSLAAFLLPYLRSGSLRLVSEATPSELDACIRLLPELIDVLPQVLVEPLSVDHEVELLDTTIKNSLQSYDIHYEASIPYCVSRLSRQFASHSAPPGPAMRFVMDLVGRRTNKDMPRTISKSWVLNAFSKRTGLPLGLIDDSQALEKEAVFAELSCDVIGQDVACNKMSSIITRIKAGVNDPQKPFGCLLLCGPTGVGKTQLAKSLAKYLYGAGGDKSRLTRLDMSEYAGPGSSFRFLHNSSGESANWIQLIRSKPLSVLLLDEIEKATPEVFDILLSVLDEGRLTDRYGRVTSFRNSIILMTSNVGATDSTQAGFGEDKSVDYESAVRKTFKPEFFNRLDDVIAFSPLSQEVMYQVTEKELRDLRSREGLERFGRQLLWSPDLVQYLANKGFQAKLGARPLQQTIEALVVAPLSKWLVENQPPSDIEVHLSWNAEAEQLVVEGR